MAARVTAYIVVAIVAVTLIAGLIVGAQRQDDSGPVDLIIYNAKVYPADGSGDFAEALAVRGNTILRVGSNREIKRLGRKQTTILDAHGGAVLPGFNEAHLHLTAATFPSSARAHRLDVIRTLIAEAHAAGVTSVQDAGGTIEDLSLFDELRQAGELRLRVYAAVSIPPGSTERDIDALEAVRQQYFDDPLFKVGAVTSASQELPALVKMLDRRGWQIRIEAADRIAVGAALDAYAAASGTNPSPARGRRHRIEHIESVDPADLPRLGTLGIIAAVQPPRGSSDGPAIPPRLGLDPAEPSRPWPEIVASGGRLAFGSAWPASPLDPRIAMQAALGTTPGGDSGPDDGAARQLLTLPALIDAYTRDAAYASFDENRKGTLAPGMLADIVILSTDIFSLPAERLLDAVVETTIFDGQVVYRRSVSATD